MDILYFRLKSDEFNRISMCKSAKDLYHMLEITHEGTNHIKES